MDESSLFQLIELIYQAATDNGSADLLSAACAKVFDSESCLIYFAELSTLPSTIPEVAGVLSKTENFTNKNMSAYVDYYHDRNEWYARAWKNNTPFVVLGQELIDTTSLLRTEWSDYLRMTDTLHVIGGQYHISKNHLGLIGIHRSPTQGAYDELDRRKMEMLLPHFQRAMQLRKKLEMAEQCNALSLDILGNLGVGMILVETDCRVLFVNRTADKLLQQQCGLIVSQGRLCPKISRDAASFRKLVSEAAKTSAGLGVGSGGVIYLSNPAGKKQPVLIAPMRSDSISVYSVNATVAVVFSAPATDGLNPESYLTQRYGLTASEARLLSALIAGQDLADYAESAGVGIGTVKTHLKSLFNKTDCHRQVELVRTVLADPLFWVVSKNK